MSRHSRDLLRDSPSWRFSQDLFDVRNVIPLPLVKNIWKGGFAGGLDCSCYFVAIDFPMLVPLDISSSQEGSSFSSEISSTCRLDPLDPLFGMDFT